MARILIVDDDPLVRDLVHASLDFGEHQLVEAHDGTEALAEAASAAPDLVVLDLDLPGSMSGLDVLQKMKGGACPAARFIVLTGSGREREAGLRAAGAAGYLTKPFSPLELIESIQAALGST